MTNGLGNTRARPSKLWSGPFFLLNASFLLVFANIAFFYLYPLALEAMGAGHHVIGMVMGIFSVAAVISRPLLGKMVALKGEYRVLSLGMGTALLTSLCYCLIESFGPFMLAIRIIHGIGFSAFIAAGFSLAAKAFPVERQGEGFSMIGVSLFGAVALAPPIGEFLINEFGFQALFIAASLCIVLAWIAALKAVPSMSAPEQENAKGQALYLPVLRNRSFLLLLCSTVIFAHCQATVPNFLALMAAEKGSASGGYFFMSYATAILTLLIAGRFVDRHGKLKLMRMSYPVFATGILLIPAMTGRPLFLLSALFYGCGMALLFPTHNALAAGHGNRTQKPVVMSVFTAVYDAGFITGAVISGWFAHLTSLTVLFVSCGIFGFVGFITVMTAPIKDDR